MASLTQRLDSLSPERRRYTLEALAGHLDTAGKHGRLQSLFANADWMHARVLSDRLRYDGYLVSVSICLKPVCHKGLRGFTGARLIIGSYAVS